MHTTTTTTETDTETYLEESEKTRGDKDKTILLLSEQNSKYSKYSSQSE